MALYLITHFKPQMLGTEPCTLRARPLSLPEAQDLVPCIEPGESPRLWYSQVYEGYRHWLGDWLGVEIGGSVPQLRVKHGDQLLLCHAGGPPARPGHTECPPHFNFTFVLLTLEKENHV